MTCPSPWFPIFILTEIRRTEGTRLNVLKIKGRDVETPDDLSSKTKSPSSIMKVIPILQSHLSFDVDYGPARSTSTWLSATFLNEIVVPVDRD